MPNTVDDLLRFLLRGVARYDDHRLSACMTSGAGLRRRAVEGSGPQRPAGPVGADDDARGRGLASNQGDEPFEDHRVIVGYEDAYSLHRYEIRPSQNLTHSEDEPCASADTWPVVGMTQEVVDG